MKLIAVPLALLLARSSHAFTASMATTTRRSSSLQSSFRDEALNPEYMKEAAKQMKNMKPEDIDQILQEMDSMDPSQLEQIKSLGMDPEMMKKSMQMMKNNPAMMESVGKMMEQLSPEEMLAQSRQAQETLKKLEIMKEPESSTSITAIAEDDEDDDNLPIVEKGAQDPAVIDAMYQVAEFMSSPPTGKVTFHAFASLPPITLLSGTREEDLSKKELAECWADGSLGSTRVDRAGFERVWMEVQEYFEDDIMEESRKTSVSKSKRGTEKAVAATPMKVGASVPPEVLAEQVKKLSDRDMDMMLNQMSQMTPEEEARMKAMGVDPKMMQRTAAMMKNNPLMKKAATAMMKNMSPEQMMKASQQAQQQMSSMSEEEIKNAMDALNKGQ